MKTVYKFLMSLILVIVVYHSSSGQINGQPFSLGKSNNLLSEIKDKASNSALRLANSSLELKVSGTKSLNAKINFNKSNPNGEYIVGSINGVSSSSFYISINDQSVEGNIILKSTKQAFKYFSDASGNAYVKEVDINGVVCIDMEHDPEQAAYVSSTPAAIGQAVLNLQSFPGGNGCVLLDFDGQYVSGTPWNGGNPINAAPSGMSDADIQEAWEIVSEDYRPFHVNITTNESVFNSYPQNRRMRCIITPTNTAAPGAGGVAYIGSFNWSDDTPCWVFITSGKYGGEACSHEVGHTFGLSHDGRELSTGHEEYYGGQGDWAPIMGVGYYKNITQFSKGEYNNANNFEDDLSKISSTTYGVGFRADAQGNSTSSAAALIYDANGNVSSSQNNGVIERTTDVDFFSFSTGGGNVVLNLNTVSRDGDLDILVRLYNQSGAQIGSYNPAGLNASVNANLGAGQYYISVDGTGAGNPATDGYSDYASLGSYWISGTIPPASVSGTAIVYKDCDFGGYAVGLNEGDYTLSQLNAKGVLNDDISSLKVNNGFEVVLYENDNFSGATVTINANTTCLVANGWNDRASSLRVRTSGVTNLAGVFYLQNRNSGLYMDVNGASSADGANIMQYTFHGGTNQQYELTHLGNGVYKIIAKNSNKSVDVSGASTSDGANVQQWTYLGGANQQFIVQSTGDGYYRLIAKHSSKLIEVAGFSTSPGGNVQQWSNVNQLSGQWKLVPVTVSYSNVIQAENYSVMNGIQTETTSDAGGGLNVGWIDTGDWMAYNSINIPATGNYTVEYRVASVSGGRLSLDLNAGSIQLGAVNVPATGGWQNWTTVSHTVSINAGTYNFGIYAQAGGWNINWFRIASQSGAAIAQVQYTQPFTAEFSLDVYPNPVDQEVKISSAFDLSEGKIQIVDAMGVEVLNTTSATDGIDVSSLRSGIYTLIFTKENSKTSKRFIKK